jgi:hypothetical protein
MDQGPHVCTLDASLRENGIPLRGRRAAIRESFRGDGLSVVRLVNPISLRRLDLQLFFRDGSAGEEELTLAVRDVETGLMLSGIAFCLVQTEGKRVVIIRGLQADDDARLHGLLREVAKEFFGLRPKALVLWCLQQLAVLWDIRQIQAIGDEQRDWQRRDDQEEETASHHDEFWRESDGRKLPGGGKWQLPLRHHCRTRNELKPSRRRMHELRYAMLAGLQPTLVAAFALLAEGQEEASRTVLLPLEHICSARGPVSCANRATLTNDLRETNHSF